MNTAVFAIAFIIVAMGLLGGWAAFLAEVPNGSPVETKQAPLKRFLVLGVVAAACVPLFLSLLKSDVVRAIFATADQAGNPVPPAYESYLIFIGLCLIAAFSARAFITSISKQVMQRLNEVDRKAEKANETADDAIVVAQEAVDEARSTETAGGEAADEGEPSSDTDELTQRAPVTPAERNALMAMAHRTYRTATGIAQDAGISRAEVSELLDGLAARKLALPTTSPSSGGKRWIITKRGRAAISAPEHAQPAGD
jgi:DNA-binding MarR family transcriptional regulator